MLIVYRTVLRSYLIWSSKRSLRDHIVHLPRKILAVQGLSTQPIALLSSFDPYLVVPFDYVSTFSFKIRPDSLLLQPLHHLCPPGSLWSSWAWNCFAYYNYSFSFHFSPKVAISMMFVFIQTGYLIFLDRLESDLETNFDLYLRD